MTKEEKLKYKNKEPIGICALSNYGSVELIDIQWGDDEDYLIIRYEHKNIYKVKLNYDRKHPYIRLFGRLYNLSDFYRIGGLL